MSSSEHKKKHEHRKKNTTLPPDVFPDGGLNSRIHGVPGSTPGCTAGAYAKSLVPEDLPELSIKTCFPDQYAAAKKWITEVRPKSLQLFLTAFGSGPTIADVVNKWLIRRVGRKCIEGTEEGRKDMEAFCVDVLKRLRKLPTCSMKLFRGVPWSAMGKSAPGLSEFEEETNIVWPTFSSLTKSETRARELLKTEGGILFVVQTDQARDVTEIASVHQADGEFMLEPNSCFTISANKDEEKIFVVEMTQLFPSVRPIMKEIEHHRHDSTRSLSADPSDPSFQMPLSPTKMERSATVVTPVLRRAPSATNSPLGRKNSLNVIGDFSYSSSTPGSPRFGRSSSRLAISQSPYKGGRTHRVQRNNLTNAMTMWSAARGYIRVLSSKSREGKHTVKPYSPPWASPDYREKKEKEEKERKEREEKEKEEKEKEKKEKEKKEKEEGKDDDDEKGKSKKDKKKDKKKKKGKGKDKVEEINTAALANDNANDDWLTPPVSPTTPGYGTMELYPESAPTYIIDDRTVDWQTLGGVILHSTRGTPLMVMTLK